MLKSVNFYSYKHFLFKEYKMVPAVWEIFNVPWSEYVPLLCSCGYFNPVDLKSDLADTNHNA